MQEQFVDALGHVHGIMAPAANAPPTIRVGLTEELAYWRTYADWAADGAPSPRLNDLLQWCGEHVPPAPVSVLLWGDARLGNACTTRRRIS